MTLRYTFDRHELVADFVARMIPHVGDAGFGNCKTIGVVDENDELIAGLVYHGLSPRAGWMQMSGAALPGRQWLTRETLRLMYQYPFIDQGCQMIVMIVPEENKRVQRLLATVGYEFVTLPRVFGRDSDAVYCYYTYEAWMESFLCKRFKHHVIYTKRAEEAA